MYPARGESYTADYQSAMSQSSSEISPSLTQSSLSTASSTSPPPPRTPRARATRYPDNLGRVPLHRRGTSQTYERLEDLLREAGYKETRVFTPEAERVKHEAPLPAPLSKQQHRAGSVVNFLSNLIPGAAAGSRPASPGVDTPTPTPPPGPFTPTRTSPLANRQRGSPMYASPHNSSGESLTRTPTRAPQPRLAHKPPLPPHALAPLHRPLPRDVRHSASIASLRRQQEKFAYQTAAGRRASAHPRQPSASVYPAPLVERPRSTPPVVRARAPPMHSSVSNGALVRGSDTVSPPPLPQTWLQTVARAVMFGGSGYVGGPLEGKENALLAPSPPPAMGPPPHLVLSKRSASAARVSETQVLCRSAPASRSGSLARSSSRRNASSAQRKVPTLEVPERGRRRQGKRGGAVPSLARTDTQGDPLRALEDPDGGDDQLSSGSVASSEDEGELNLAKMLVPPKRQHSIRSLRRHLAPPPTPSSASPFPSGTMRSDRSVRDVVNASPVPRAADHAVDLNDAAEEYLMFLEGSGARRDGGSRRSLPRTWGGRLRN